MDALAILKEVSRKDGVNGRIVEAVSDAAALLGEDSSSLDEMLIQACGDAPAGINEPCRSLFEAGGKRIRPMLCLLAFRATGGLEPLPLDLAISCELLHNATLLHDDVVDEGEFRRGRPAARVVYGNAVSVLGGDYLLVRTIEKVSKCGSKHMDFLVRTLRQLISGELAQLKRRGSIGTTEEEYYSIIQGKTASLFRWAANAGALAAGADDKLCQSFGQFGWHTGIAFQLVDDVLDFTADASELGKSLLTDISEGKMTLPVILAGRKSLELKTLLEQLLEGVDPAVVAPQVASLVKSTGAVAEARERAGNHTAKAIEALHSTSGLDSQAVGVLEKLSLALLERES